MFDCISILKTRCASVSSKPLHTILFHRSGMVLYGPLFSTTTPFLEFSIQFQSNNLIYDKGYSTRQYMIYSLIQLMKEEGMGYRRISKKLNQWGIKTHRGCEWFNTSVSSVLKRKHERDDLVNNIRNKHYPSRVFLLLLRDPKNLYLKFISQLKVIIKDLLPFKSILTSFSL